MAANNAKVKLVSAANPNHKVVFRATPQVVENRNVNYTALEPLHAPGQIQVYKNTASRNFNISDLRLVSRTREEADRNLDYLWKLRSWCMPRFGNSSTLTNDPEGFGDVQAREQSDQFDIDNFNGDYDAYREFFGVELLGAPPEVLYLTAYSYEVGVAKNPENQQPTNVWTVAQHINKVPVVIQQLAIPYPNDVDYITTSRGVPMPIIMNLDISLIETHSPNGYELFSLDDFKKGILRGY